MSDYETFLASKEHAIPEVGPECGPIHPGLHAFAGDIVRWAVRRGRACIFADTGLSKTRMQLEWLRHILASVGPEARGLIVAPLAVAAQTIAEGRVLGLDVREVARPDPTPGIQIVNYEKLSHFVGAGYSALVLDESSRLASEDGKQRTLILRELAPGIPFRLACTATPMPNDVSELANHAEYVGAMSRVEMLATFFVHDENGWRLKGHAADAMWRWMAKWAVYVRRPSDLGYSDEGFALPPLEIRDEVVRADWKPAGMLFATGLGGVGGRAEVRRATLDVRVARAAEIIRETPDQWVVWSGLNDEARDLADALGDEAVNIEGADSEEEKLAKLAAWQRGEKRTLISKLAILGFGLNLQSAHRMMFLGLSDSWQSYYQGIRREWRFGQKHPVDVRIVISDAEGEIAANVRRKESDAARVAEGVVGAMQDEQIAAVRGVEKRGDEYRTGEASGEGWRLMLGDCVDRIREVETGSVGLSVFSPPFAQLYCYSASTHDMGNSRDYDQFFRHFGFLIPELLRVTMPGRRACVHVQQVSTTKAVHGVIGWRDFRADTVRAFVAAGWVYDGEVVIDKDPQAQAIRTKAKALMFVQKNKDSAWSRPAMADYILLFRAPGDNPEPVKTDVTNEEWIQWARPIWYGIRESDTLQYQSAREDKDEKHLAPLQIGTVERCVRLWSNKGDLVFTPFAGIGTELYTALRNGRRAHGIELKPSYHRTAVRNIQGAVAQQSLFAAEGA